MNSFLKGPKLRKHVLGLSPGEGGFCSSVSKHDIKTALKAKLPCFGDDSTRTKFTILKIFLVSSPDEDFGFRDYLFLWI